MDSRAPHPDHARDVLGERRDWRLFAITAWSGFLGAALMLLAALVLLPAASLEEAGWAELSLGFLCAWVLAMVPAGMAVLLAAPRRGAGDPDDGR